jgi:xanthine dehydrogenase accessory factor
MTVSPPTADLAPTSDATPLGGQRAVIAGLQELAGRGVAGVLALVVGTSGSTYRKPGALILLDAQGVRAGALSGGCLEAELEACARAVLEQGIAGEAHFDTTGDEDRIFGSATGCGGSTHVLLLPVPAAESPLRDALLGAEGAGEAAILTLALSAEHLGSGEARRTSSSHAFDRRGAADTRSLVADDAVTLTIRPSRRLLLLGAGPETAPLLALTRLLGWRIELLEHRERWLRFAEGRALDALHRDGPDSLPHLVEHTRFDAALVMNHNVHLDARCLTHLAASDLRYVGLLGPAARRDDLLAEIGVDAAGRLRPRLHAPVGLALGGEGAEAIGIAIVAELQREFARDARR